MTVGAPASRVLHLIPSLAEGGAERQLGYLGAELVRRGWAVDVALLSGGPNLERLERGGATINRLAAHNNHDPRLLLQIHRLVRERRPDVVHTWLTQMDVLGGVVALINRIPWVLGERSHPSAYPSTVKNTLRTKLACHADAIVSNSRAGDLYWKTRAGRRVLRFLVPNAVTVEGNAEGSALCHEVAAFVAGDRLALFVGRLSDEKEPATFLKALALELARSLVKGVICGDGPLRNDLERLLPELGLTGRVRLLGNVANIWPLLRRADLLVSTSLFEGEPNAVLEAMACGCPLVLSDIQAHRDLVGGDAIYAKPRAAAEFASAIAAVLANPEDARQRADQARKRAGRRSPEAMAAGYDQVYRAVLARRERPAQGGA